MTDVPKTIFIFGGNEIASAAAARLFKSGYDVVMFSDPAETLLRYHLSLGDALHQGQKIVEDISGITLPEDVLADIDAAPYTNSLEATLHFVLKDRKIPVINQDGFEEIAEMLPPQVIINCQTEVKTPVSIDRAPLVIGLYPHHNPGINCHVAVESRLTYYLGRIFSTNTSAPDEVLDIHFFKDPFVYCRTPVEGIWLSLKAIGDKIRYNEPIGKINDIEIRSPHDGQLWGLAHSGRIIAARDNVALIYQGKPSERYRYLGFRENAIAGGILQAILQYGEF
jgi:xanthine dehydrogenase accessory factor